MVSNWKKILDNIYLERNVKIKISFTNDQNIDE